MICGWKAQRASSLVAVALVMTSVATLATESSPWPPRLILPSDIAHDSELMTTLDTDRDWLARQPAWQLTAPAPTDSLAIMAWLQRGHQHRPADVDSTRTRDLPPRLGQRTLLVQLRDRWLARGYLAVEVVPVDTVASDSPAAVSIVPGKRFRIGTIDVGGEPFPERDRILAAWLPRRGDVFVADTYGAAAEGVVRECAELGYPFPFWLTKQVRRDLTTGTVDLVVTLVPGQKAFIGPQMTTLPVGRSSRFVVRVAGIGHGRLFRESDLRRGVDRLLARDLYVRVDEPVVHLTAARDTVGILWRVEPEEKRNRVAVVAGLSRQQDGGSRWSGQVDIDLPDLAGTGRRFKARWSDDGQQRSRFGFSYLEPLVLGTPLDADVAVENEVLDESYTRLSLENRWRMQVVALWGLELGVGWDRTTFPAGDLERTSRTRGRVAILHGRGDRTRSGWSATVAVETANRRATLRLDAGGDALDAGGALGTEATQRLLEADLGGEIWLRSAVSLAARASFRQIDAEDLPAPLSEQYRFGGANSLRGYREEEFRGETVSWGGVEWRLGRARRSRVYTFLDVGYFEFTVREGDDEILATRRGTNLGYGLGLRTFSTAGRIDLAVGFPGSVNFDTAKLHVSLVGSF